MKDVEKLQNPNEKTFKRITSNENKSNNPKNNENAIHKEKV